MMHVGSASIVINGDIGAHIQGATVAKRAKKIRDNLEANALFIGGSEGKILFVSCDLVGVPSDINIRARKRMAEETKIPERNIIIAGTHTHSGPSVIKTHHAKPVDTAYFERLIEWLTTLAVQAVTSARHGKIGWDSGSTRIGYNRRCCWADGSHTLNGDTSRDDFTGLEGPDDPAHLVIAARDAADKTIAILQNNTTHPTCFYGADFFSADCPGASRSFLRNIFGEIPVLFFNAAFGDINIADQSAPGDKGGEQQMLRAAHLMTGETLRLLHKMRFSDSPVIKHDFEDMAVPVRLPSKEKLAWAEDVLKRVENGDKIDEWDKLFAFGTVCLAEEFGDDPVDTIPVHAIRIDDLAIVTQPCELYCQFGLDIKRRSPASATAIFGIADGYCGYCPTVQGIMGGGYSGVPICWTRLSEYAGYQIVDTASRLIREVMKQQNR